MTWLTTNNSIDIRSFGEAEHYFNKIEPIKSPQYRNKDVDGVPIMTHRRDWRHKSLHKLDDDTYSMRLYDTDVVKVHRDNSVTVDLSYPSSTTDAWANHWVWQLTGMSLPFWSYNKGMAISWGRVNPIQLAQYREHVPLSKQEDIAYFYTDIDQFRLAPIGGGQWHIHDVAPRFVKRVDKSAAYHKRKVLQPMLNYLKVFEAMPMDEDTYRDLLKEFSDEHGWNASPVKMAVDSPDDSSLWAYVAASFHTMDWSYDSQNHTHTRATAMDKLPTIKKKLYQFLYDKEGINGFQQLALGESRHAELYTQRQVENYNG